MATAAVPARPEAGGKPEKLTAFVGGMVDIGARELQSMLELEPEQARTVMRHIAHEICKVWARSYIYVPTDIEVEISARDLEIWREYGQDSATARKFTPDRISELSTKYRMTTVHMYNILRLMRAKEKAREAREFAERQGSLALEGGE